MDVERKIRALDLSMVWFELSEVRAPSAGEGPITVSERSLGVERQRGEELGNYSGE